MLMSKGDVYEYAPKQELSLFAEELYRFFSYWGICFS